MKSIKWIKGKYFDWLSKRDKLEILSRGVITNINPDYFPDSIKNPNDYYYRAFQDFHKNLPDELRLHRAYFCRDRRGFGEDAFHTMWWRLITKFKPKSFLEIGVYRGQVLSLISLLSRLEGMNCCVTGISPFCSAGDSVSQYMNEIDYQNDTLAHFKHFHLAEPRLIKAYSTDSEAIELIESQEWDMIYIDGNHDYDIVKRDWEVCSKAVKIGGLIILDDSGLSTSYNPPSFATGGHPGPSKLASEIDSARFKEILQVGHNRVFQKL